MLYNNACQDDLRIDTQSIRFRDRSSPSAPVTPICEETPTSMSDATTVQHLLISSHLHRTRVAPSQILPFLFLGSKWDALDEEFLHTNQIKFILNISREASPNQFGSVIGSQHIHHKHIFARDDPDQDLTGLFSEAFCFIDRAKEANMVSPGSSILVHCVHGISRSPTIVLAYLMQGHGLSLNEAMEHVRSRRLVISPNFGFLYQLKEYEQRLMLLRK